ncbi:MAG: urease accessory protein UreD, partial [Pseudomonadota bacterium]
MTATATKARAEPLPNAPAMQRSKGGGALTVRAANDGQTRIADLYQHANAKIRVPKTHDNALTAVLINTAGGLTGGDELDWRFEAQTKTKLTVSTQACERVYRALDGQATVRTELAIHDGARLAWLPQETILFDGAALDRSLDVDMASTAELLAMEIIVLGREAMRETVSSVTLKDRWRVRRDNRLVHAEQTRLTDKIIENLSSAAALDGHTVFATLLYVPSAGPIPSKDEILTLNAKIQAL